MPFALTSGAIAKLDSELGRHRQIPGQAFRLHASSSGEFGLRLDLPDPRDVVLRHEGLPLLVIETALADRLSDAALDVGRGPDEPEWVLVRGAAPRQAT
jgi:hypothetical protein